MKDMQRICGYPTLSHHDALRFGMPSLLFEMFLFFIYMKIAPFNSLVWGSLRLAPISESQHDKINQQY